MTDAVRVDFESAACAIDQYLEYHDTISLAHTARDFIRYAETLAAEVARMRPVVEAAAAWERCGNWSIADDQAMDLAAAVHKYRANPQEVAPESPSLGLALSDEEWGSLGIEPDAPAPAEPEEPHHAQ